MNNDIEYIYIWSYGFDLIQIVMGFEIKLLS